MAIENVDAAINQIAQTTLRMVVGRHTLDETLSETDRINVDIREILDRTTTEWGVEVTLVELKDIQLGSFLARESTAAVGAARSGDLAALTTLGTANGTTDTTRTPAP